jgi:threonylcarbamoyladenosine tRNA methylthiotransferase MtaB
VSTVVERLGVKYAVITFGCRVNQADSLGFEEALRAAGAVAAASPADADLVVVNTCSVTATSDQGARQTIRRVARDNPSARIMVTGCYATRRPDEVAALPNVVRVVTNDDKPRLVHLVPNLTTAQRFGDGEGGCGAAIEPGAAGRTAFTLRVQTGCAEPCSYCIIPATRGAPRSVPMDDVLREVERVASAGFKEIALTGVHLGSYGRDLTSRSSLIDLLRALSDVRLRPNPAYDDDADGRRVRLQPDRERRESDDRSATALAERVLFRISSLEPMDCTREIVDLVATSDSFAPHFHLPLQHAGDRVLAAMRRPYAIRDYAALVDDIRARIPNAAIGSDIIVGFPGESDDDFEALASYLERSPLTHLHVFPYSDRSGTEASMMRAKVPGPVVRERGRRVREIGQRLAARFKASQIGSVHRALTLEDGSLVVTGNYLKLRVPPLHSRNQWVRVRVTSDHDGELLGG